eukprot:363461-Chlamydomonas_euryale.AAC.6
MGASDRCGIAYTCMRHALVRANTLGGGDPRPAASGTALGGSRPVAEADTSGAGRHSAGCRTEQLKPAPREGCEDGLCGAPGSPQLIAARRAAPAAVGLCEVAASHRPAQPAAMQHPKECMTTAAGAAAEAAVHAAVACKPVCSPTAAAVAACKPAYSPTAAAAAACKSACSPTAAADVTSSSAAHASALAPTGVAAAQQLCRMPPTDNPVSPQWRWQRRRQWQQAPSSFTALLAAVLVAALLLATPSSTNGGGSDRRGGGAEVSGQPRHAASGGPHAASVRWAQRHPEFGYRSALPRNLLDRTRAVMGDETRARAFVRKLVSGACGHTSLVRSYAAQAARMRVWCARASRACAHADTHERVLTKCTCSVCLGAHARRACPPTLQLAWLPSLQVPSHGSHRCMSHRMALIAAGPLAWLPSLQVPSHGSHRMAPIAACRIAWLLSLQVPSYGFHRCRSHRMAPIAAGPIAWLPSLHVPSHGSHRCRSHRMAPIAAGPIAAGPIAETYIHSTHLASCCLPVILNMPDSSTALTGIPDACLRRACARACVRCGTSTSLGLRK